MTQGSLSSVQGTADLGVIDMVLVLQVRELWELPFTVQKAWEARQSAPEQAVLELSGQRGHGSCSWQCCAVATQPFGIRVSDLPQVLVMELRVSGLPRWVSVLLWSHSFLFGIEMLTL